MAENCSAAKADKDQPAEIVEARPAASGGSAVEIVARENFSNATYLLEILHPMLARAAEPGQFVIVISHERGERIPLTIADFDREKGTVTLVVQAVGKTTRQMQQDCQVGTTLYGVAGPMGVPSHIGKAKKVVCVGGGLGVAPVFPQARAFKQHGAYVIAVLGFRGEAFIFWEDKFKRYCDELIVCTDDGSRGIKGLVTEGIKAAVAAHDDIDELVAVGPPLMMKACAEATRPHNIHTIVSLNPIMVDGTGMCGGCRVRVGGKMMFACVDGPEFDGHAVDFDDLLNRLKRFSAEEELATKRWAETCRLLKQEPAPEASARSAIAKPDQGSPPPDVDVAARGNSCGSHQGAAAVATAPPTNPSRKPRPPHGDVAVDGPSTEPTP